MEDLEATPSAMSDETGALTLLALPDDALCEILSHLDFRSLLDCALVCKAFYRLLSDPQHGNTVWKSVLIAPAVTPRPYADPASARQLCTWVATRSLGMGSLHVCGAVPSGLLGSLGPLRHLESLVLQSCSLRQFAQEWCPDLTALTSLSLAGNYLRELPGAFATLTRLRRLDLSGNVLLGDVEIDAGLLPTPVAALKGLEWLSIARTAVAHIDPLPGLTYLDASFAPLRPNRPMPSPLATAPGTAPGTATTAPVFCGMPRLRELHLSGVFPSEVDLTVAGIRALDQLTHLDVSHCPSMGVRGLSQLTSLSTLQALHARSCGLSGSVAPVLARNPDLRVLEISGQTNFKFLAEVAAGLGGVFAFLPRLTRLQAQGHPDGASLPTHRGDCSTLAGALVGCSRVHGGPWVATGTALRSLDISYVRDPDFVSRLPEIFRNLPNLEDLAMDNVHVAVADPPADASLWQLSRLTRLSCAHALLPWHLRLPETLRRLDAAGARVVRGQRGDASTGPQSLDDEMCGIPGSLSGLTSLTHLDLSEWAEDPLALHLTAGAPLLPKLKTLVLDHCRSLTSASLDRALSHGAEVSSASTPSLADNAGSTTRKGVPSSLGCLEDLSMAWSGLGRGGERESAGQLPASVSRLTQLTRLRLSGCADLRGTLCEGIGALRRLRELHLDGTQIDALPRNARGLTDLRSLVAVGSPLSPSDLVPLVDALPRLHDVRLSTVDWATPALTSKLRGFKLCGPDSR